MAVVKALAAEVQPSLAFFIRRSLHERLLQVKKNMHAPHQTLNYKSETDTSLSFLCSIGNTIGSFMQKPRPLQNTKQGNVLEFHHHSAPL